MSRLLHSTVSPVFPPCRVELAPRPSAPPSALCLCRAQPPQCPPSRALLVPALRGDSSSSSAPDMTNSLGMNGDPWCPCCYQYKIPSTSTCLVRTTTTTSPSRSGLKRGRLKHTSLLVALCLSVGCVPVTRGPWYARGCPRDMGRPIAEWCVTQPVTRCACWFRAPALLGWKSGRAVSPAECGHMVRESIWVEEHNVPRSDFLGREAGHLTETCRSATQFGNLSPLSLASRRVVPARLAGVCPARS